MKNKICIVGFPKCGQISLMRYLKRKYPKAEVLRPEIIWEDTIRFTKTIDIKEFSVIVITRNPVDRIQSGIRYWENIRKTYETFGIEKVLKGIGPFGFKTGWQDPIEQSNYSKYIEKFEIQYDVNIEKVYELEKMITDPDFYYHNVSENKTTFSKDERNLIQIRIDEMLINAY